LLKSIGFIAPKYFVVFASNITKRWQVRIDADQESEKSWSIVGKSTTQSL